MMRILIYVTGQSCSKPAVLFGGLLARQTQASVTLLTVIGETQFNDAAQQSLDLARRWIWDLEAATSVRVGDEINCILEEIGNGNYDLIILKARQAILIKDFLMTKIGPRMARLAPISIVVIKESQLDLKRILVCTGGLEIADPVIEMSSHLAQSTQAKVTLLHILRSIPSMYTGLDKIEEQLSDLLQTNSPVAHHLRQAAKLLAESKVAAELRLRQGVVPNIILNEARAGNYDLIALGASKASSNLTGWLLGEIAQKIIIQAPCPVLVVKERINLSNGETLND